MFNMSFPLSVIFLSACLSLIKCQPHMLTNHSHPGVTNDYDPNRDGNSCLPSQIPICGVGQPCNCQFNLGAAKIDCTSGLSDDNPSADVCPTVDLQNRYRLKQVYLRHNHIRQLERDHLVTGFEEEIEVLDLSWNLIEKIDNFTFRQYANLQNLAINNNRISELTRSTFNGLKSLEELDLRNLLFLYLNGNPFTEIGPNEFLGVPNLEGLYIQEAPNLWFVDDCAFCGLDQLNTLLMDDCPNLALIGPKAFGDTVGRSMEMIDLSNGSLRSLPESLLTWAKVKSTRLDLNPWVCDCRISWMRNSRYSLIGPILCSSPQMTIGRDVRDLSDDQLLCSNFNTRTSLKSKILVVLFTLIFLFSCLIATWLLYHSQNRRFHRYTHSGSQSTRVTFAYSNLGKSDCENNEEKGKERPPLLNSVCDDA